jgi:hypothetical protein
MKVPETAFKLAFFGMKHEAGDIIDYVAICFSLVTSLLAGIVAAIWFGHIFGALSGLMAGIGFYGLSMILCSLALGPKNSSSEK